MTRRLAVLLAAASLTLLAACGGGSGEERPAADATSDLQKLVLASASKATEAKTAHFEFTAEVPGPEGAPVTIKGTGAVDNSRPLISMQMDTGGLLPGGQAGGDTTTSFVFDGQAFFMRFPEALSAQLGGKHWVRFDANTLSAQSGLDFEELLAQFRSSDPLANLSLLTGAAEDVTEVGEEDVRGVATRHFKVTVSVEKSLAQVPERFRPAMSQLTEQLGTRTLPVDVWIGDDGLPRRLNYEVDLSKASIPGTEGLSGSVKTTMDVFDYGKPVEATVPPPEDTVNLGELIGQQGY